MGISHELEDSIERLTAGSVVSRMFYEIERIATPESPDENWLNQMLQVIQFSQEIETGFGHTKAYALAVIKKHWDDIPYETRKKYNLDFMYFARQVTGRDTSTILNYITTANVWFVDKVKPEGTLSLKLRDVSGQLILNDKTGEPRTKTVEFDPYTINMSKLLLVNSKASKGEMTPEIWEMLADNYYSCEDLRKKVSPAHSSENEFYFFVEGPGLFLRNGPFVICISEELNWLAYDTDPKTKQGMDKFFSILNININSDDDKLYEAVRQMNDNRHQVYQGILQ